MNLLLGFSVSLPILSGSWYFHQFLVLDWLKKRIVLLLEHGREIIVKINVHL